VSIKKFNKKSLKIDSFASREIECIKNDPDFFREAYSEMVGAKGNVFINGRLRPLIKFIRLDYMISESLTSDSFRFRMTKPDGKIIAHDSIFTLKIRREIMIASYLLGLLRVVDWRVTTDWDLYDTGQVPLSAETLIINALIHEGQT